MDATEKSTAAHQKKIIFLFLILAMTFAALTLVPEVRNRLNSLFKSEHRNILAKITGYFSTEQTQLLILKVKDVTGLQIEIYEIESANGAQKFKQKFDLSEDADSYVTIDKNSTNLALQDVDQDGNLDIIAPSVDRSGNLRLNTYRFNAETKLFEPFAPK